jgi:hypothetical protein
MKLQEENTGKTCQDIEMGKKFLCKILKTWEIGKHR